MWYRYNFIIINRIQALLYISVFLSFTFTVYMTSTMSNFMELQIKSLEQQTFPITISRNASVSDLKREIKIAVNIDCHRQRLIFQGRVLKDDKQLTHYGNHLLFLIRNQKQWTHCNIFFFYFLLYNNKIYR